MRFSFDFEAEANAASPCQGVPYIHSSLSFRRKMMRSSLKISGLGISGVPADFQRRVVVLLPAPEWPRKRKPPDRSIVFHHQSI